MYEPWHHSRLAHLARAAVDGLGEGVVAAQAQVVFREVIAHPNNRLAQYLRGLGGRDAREQEDSSTTAQQKGGASHAVLHAVAAAKARSARWSEISEIAGGTRGLCDCERHSLCTWAPCAFIPRQK